jgi:hypothetical protein
MLLCDGPGNELPNDRLRSAAAVVLRVWPRILIYLGLYLGLVSDSVSDSDCCFPHCGGVKSEN